MAEFVDQSLAGYTGKLIPPDAILRNLFVNLVARDAAGRAHDEVLRANAARIEARTGELIAATAQPARLRELVAEHLDDKPEISWRSAIADEAAAAMKAGTANS